MKLKLLAAGLSLALGTIFCTLAPTPVTSPTADVSGLVSATLTAMAGADLPEATATETLSTTPMSAFPETGTISGGLSYPSSFLPAMRVVAWSVLDGGYHFVDTAVGQFEYAIEVPVGAYYIVSYSLGEGGAATGLAGGYTEMVPCGLQYGCDNHTLIVVNVTAGSLVSGIDPGDWYADPMAYPDLPTP